MSGIFRNVLIVFGLTYVALWSSEAMSIRHAGPASLSRCDTKQIARAGRLTYAASYNAWVSSRGDLFRVRDCPVLKDMRMASTH
jgi:hypothetical protein